MGLSKLGVREVNWVKHTGLKGQGAIQSQGERVNG